MLAPAHQVKLIAAATTAVHAVTGYRRYSDQEGTGRTGTPIEHESSGHDTQSVVSVNLSCGDGYKRCGGVCLNKLSSNPIMYFIELGIKPVA
jgi:hypothetical protein